MSDGQLHDISVAIGELRAQMALTREDVRRGFGKVDKRLESIEQRVDGIEKKEDLRQGGTNLRDWTLKHLPSIAAVVVVIFAVVVVTLKTRGLM